MAGHYAIGLMSGTSADGIDAALVHIEEKDGSEWPTIHLKHTIFVPFASNQRQRILDLCTPNAPLFKVGKLHAELGQWFGQACQRLLDEAEVAPNDVAVIGSHGQTIAHYPSRDGQTLGFTIQIGDPAIIAAMTGIGVVSQFRNMDMAVGGQGAPLVPYFDYALLRSPNEDRVLLNVGGVANITVIPQSCAIEDVLGFDTGPGNMVLDGLVELISQGALHYDQDGQIAARGGVDTELLTDWLSHPYLSLLPPKSTGREEFGREYCTALYQQMQVRRLSPEDMLRTATAFVAHTIAQGIHLVQNRPFALIAAGGGARNPVLMQELTTRLTLLRPWETTSQHQIPGDAKEAMAFAYLAWQFTQGRATNLPRVTGARRTVLQGQWSPARTGAPIF